MLVEIGVATWYFLYWNSLAKYSIQRLFAWAMFLGCAIAIPLLQIAIYKEVTSKRVVDDVFAPLLIFFESAASVALAFYLLRRRSRNLVMGARASHVARLAYNAAAI